MSLALGLVRQDLPTRWFVAAYVALNVLDLLTTYLALARGARELTPLYAGLFAAFPFAIGAAVKLLLAPAFFVATSLLACAHPTPYSHAILCLELATLCALLALAALFNQHMLAFVRA